MSFYEARIAGLRMFWSCFTEHQYGRTLDVFDAFQESHPGYNVPNHQECLLYSAAKAAELSNSVRYSRLSTEYRGWRIQSSFSSQGGGLSDEAVLNPDVASVEMENPGTHTADMTLTGQSISCFAGRLMK